MAAQNRPLLIADREPARRAERADAARSLQYARSHARLFPGAGTAWMPLAEGCAVFTGTGSPLSKAVGMGAGGDIGPKDIDALESFYQDHGMPAALDLAPFAGPSLLELLAVRGYTISYFLNILALPLAPSEHNSSPDSSSPSTDGYHIRRVSAEDEHTWIETVAAGFAGDTKPGREDREIFTTQFHAENAHCFIAEMDGEPVGGGLVAIADGTALLGAASVLPGHRGHGIHRALVRERLAHAAGLGCDLGVTGATPGSVSQRNLQRYGFQILYTRPSLRRSIR